LQFLFVGATINRRLFASGVYRFVKHFTDKKRDISQS
jgi:hypothetical protein